MKKRLISILFWALVLHLIVSVAFILDPPFLNSTWISKIYKTYLLPGPFFTDSRIIDNYSLSISWKMNGSWMPPITPAKEDFNRYHTSLNPSDLYRSRIDRTVYSKLTLPDSSITDIKNRKEFQQLKQYLFDHHVPREADSVQMWIINKQAENFMLRTDSVCVLFSR